MSRKVVLCVVCSVALHSTSVIAWLAWVRSWLCRWCVDENSNRTLGSNFLSRSLGTTSGKSSQL